jgi:type IV pilus assembly protein PilW
MYRSPTSCNNKTRYPHRGLHRLTQRGFSLVELMVAMVIGLLTTLCITQVLLASEGQRRTTTTGADAQVNGALAIDAIQRDIQMAGYGFSSSTSILGCAISAKYNGAQIATGAATPTFPTTLAPVQIDATDPTRNVIRVLASAKASYSIPTRVISPSYNPAGAGTTKVQFTVASTLGVANGDLVLAAKNGTPLCEVFQVTAAPSVDGQINRADAATGWNPPGFPTATYNDGDLLVNLGSLIDRRYSISSANVLQLTEFSAAAPAATATPVDLYPNVVGLQALYGKDTDSDGVVDAYNRTAPTSATEWAQVLSIRLALVTRSAQYEKELVTTASPLWNVGSTTTVSGTAACGTSKCLTLDITALPDWQHYRYKVYDTVVPLRNLLWTS